MLGGTTTVKFTPLLASVPTVTTTFPVLAPVGTAATMLVGLQLLGVAAVPLNVTVLLPCVVPKFVPVMVIGVATAPDVGFTVVMFGATVNAAPLPALPETVTTTLPVVAAAGTLTVMLVAFQLVAVPADAPLNVTVLLPCVVPKFVPVMVTGVPTTPNVGLKLVMLGGVTTVKFTPLLASVPAVTTTLPVLAPAGTVTPMLVALQLENVVAAVPLNVTVLLPCVVPKFVPVMVIGVATAPDAGLKLVILGAEITVKPTPLLDTPETFTTAFPVLAPLGTVTAMLVAPQLENVVAAVPLKVTVLLPCVVPKFVPVMVTGVPTAPDVGLKLVMLGAVLPVPLPALNAASAAAQ